MQLGRILVYEGPKCYRQRRPLAKPVNSLDRATLAPSTMTLGGMLKHLARFVHILDTGYPSACL
jgi:hypothetical protein